jgi:hypothetical protein
MLIVEVLEAMTARFGANLSISRSTGILISKISGRPRSQSRVPHGVFNRMKNLQLFLLMDSTSSLEIFLWIKFVQLSKIFSTLFPPFPNLRRTDTPRSRSSAPSARFRGPYRLLRLRRFYADFNFISDSFKSSFNDYRKRRSGAIQSSPPFSQSFS